jgi:hypothetical protein
MTDLDTMKAVQLHPTAIDTIRDMQLQANLVAAAWERFNPAYGIKTTASLAQQVTSLLIGGWGGDQEVYRDGDLSLFVRTPTIQFGVIGHRTPRADAPSDHHPRFMSGTRAPVEGLFCLMHGKCGAPVYQGETSCNHDDSMVFVMPNPIEWSFHS